jgi:hypothetical protein
VHSCLRNVRPSHSIYLDNLTILGNSCAFLSIIGYGTPPLRSHEREDARCRMLIRGPVSAPSPPAGVTRTRDWDSSYYESWVEFFFYFFSLVSYCLNLVAIAIQTEASIAAPGG